MSKKIIVAVVGLVLLAGAGFAVYRFVPLDRDVTTADGRRYQGSMLNGRFHGRGVMTYPPAAQFKDLLTYTGDFVDSRRHGQGTAVWRNGLKYEGGWWNDNLNGWGVMDFRGHRNHDDLVSYTGNFVNGLRSGQGALIWKNGDKYAGQWTNGQITGRGVLTYGPDEPMQAYEGDLVEGQMQGQGTMTWKDGSGYEGRWKDGMMHGRGIMTYPSDQAEGRLTYEGEFVNSEPDGQGVMTWSDGSRYDGQWRKNRQSGRGTLTLKDGGKYEGTWQAGRKFNGTDYDSAGRKISRIVDGEPGR